jgi:hypothetical protein
MSVSIVGSSYDGDNEFEKLEHEYSTELTRNWDPTVSRPQPGMAMDDPPALFGENDDSDEDQLANMMAQTSVGRSLLDADQAYKAREAAAHATWRSHIENRPLPVRASYEAESSMMDEAIRRSLLDADQAYKAPEAAAHATWRRHIEKRSLPVRASSEEESSMMDEAIRRSLLDAAGPHASVAPVRARSRDEPEIRRNKIAQARADKMHGLNASFQEALGDRKGKMNADEFEALRRWSAVTDDDTEYSDDY